jgi:hypothetical protein
VSGVRLCQFWTVLCSMTECVRSKDVILCKVNDTMCPELGRVSCRTMLGHNMTVLILSIDSFIPEVNHELFIKQAESDVGLCPKTITERVSSQVV